MTKYGCSMRTIFCQTRKLGWALAENISLHALAEYLYNIQGKVDSSASKPALVQDTNYMVEKPYHNPQNLGACGPYLMPQ